MVCRIGMYALLFGAALSAGSAFGVTNVTWKGGTGTWSTAANWDLNLVPNNNGSNLYSVFVDGSKTATASTVTISSGETIVALTIDSGDKVSDTGTSPLILTGGTLTNNGNLTMTGTPIEATGATTFSLAGTGTLTLVSGQAWASLITVNPGAVVTGYGTFGGVPASSGTVSNSGTVTANVAGQTLTVGTSSTTTADINSGIFSATQGGTLKFNRGFVNTNGTINADGAGSVVVIGGIVSGGQIFTSNAGTVRFTGECGISGASLSGTFTGSTVGHFTISGSSTLNGTLSLGGGDKIIVLGNASLLGTGTLTLVGDSIDSSEAANLTIGAGQIVHGNGTIGGTQCSVTNNGLITADAAGNAITLRAFSDSHIVNSGTIKASSAGSVTLLSGLFTNTAGSIIADGSGSTVFIGSSTTPTTINGGTISAINGGTVSIKALVTLGNVTLSATGVSATAPTFFGNVTNNTILTTKVNTSGIAAAISGNTTFLGNGPLVLAGDINGSATSALTNSASHTISGNGYVTGVALNNAGTFLANVPGKTLSFGAPSGTTNVNTGLLKATNGGLLNVGGLTISPGSTVIADTGSKITFNGGSISGGTTFLLNSGGTMAFWSVNLDSTLQLPVADQATLIIVTNTFASPQTLTAIHGGRISLSLVNLPAGSTLNADGAGLPNDLEAGSFSGTINLTNGAVANVVGETLSDVIINGPLVEKGDITLGGTVTNNGPFSIVPALSQSS